MIIITQEKINQIATRLQELHAEGASAAYTQMYKIYEEACRLYAAGENDKNNMLAFLEK